MTGFVSRAQWGAQPGRNPGPFRNFEGVMIHWRGGGSPGAHSACAGQVRDQQRRDMANGHADLMYSFICCVHGFVFEGRPARISVSSNGAANNANFRWASVCAWVGPGNAQPAILHDAMRDAVNRVNGWGIGAVRTIVPHSANVATQCPGDQLRTLINQGRFRPGPVTPPPPTGGNPWNMTIQQFEASMRRIMDERINAQLGAQAVNNPNTALNGGIAQRITLNVRAVLNEGTGVGQIGWANTNRAILSSVQGNFNRMNALSSQMEQLVNNQRAWMQAWLGGTINRVVAIYNALLSSNPVQASPELLAIDKAPDIPLPPPASTKLTDYVDVDTRTQQGVDFSDKEPGDLNTMP